MGMENGGEVKNGPHTAAGLRMEREFSRDGRLFSVDVSRYFQSLGDQENGAQQIAFEGASGDLALQSDPTAANTIGAISGDLDSAEIRVINCGRRTNWGQLVMNVPPFTGARLGRTAEPVFWCPNRPNTSRFADAYQVRRVWPSSNIQLVTLATRR